MNKLLTIGIWSILMLAMGTMLVVGYWLLHPYEIVTFSDDVLPIMNENKSVKQGDQVVYSAKTCKLIDMDATVDRQIIDGVVYSLPTVTSNIPVGCRENLVYIEVPKVIPVGKVTIKILYRYKVNPIRSIVITKTTEPFFITR